MKKTDKINFIIKTLEDLFPKTDIPLNHKDPYTLLIAVLLSAQSTDAGVNKITPILFKKADNPYDMIKLSVEEIRSMIRPVGLSPMKSKGIFGLSKIIIEKHNGKVPKNLEDLEPTERPIHSVEDKKKRQFYVKDETGWECDKKEEKIDQTIDSVTKKQINKIKEWESSRPDWNDSEQGIEDYMKMIQTIMGGSTQYEREQNRKLIKKELTENVDINEACNVIKINE